LTKHLLSRCQSCRAVRLMAKPIKKPYKMPRLSSKNGLKLPGNWGDLFQNLKADSFSLNGMVVCQRALALVTELGIPLKAECEVLLAELEQGEDVEP
jgi:hypothetical protein